MQITVKHYCGSSKSVYKVKQATESEQCGADYSNRGYGADY
jgi:hypothetical protein